MEKKQLNFSAPLISARRYSSPLRRDSPPEGIQNTIPAEQLDSNLGEVVKPGSVPFIWEQIPGKAKSSNASSQVQSPEEIPSTPKLPPAFQSRKSGELNGFRTPNKLSGELVVLKQRNKLSGELNVLRSHSKMSGELAFANKFTHLDYNNRAQVNVSASSESDYDDSKTFSEAHETSSVNCSISGLSGSERSEIRPPSMARDFMMDRFLPAAKAMTLEPSQYSSRKQLMVVEQPKEVKAFVPRAKTPPPSRNLCHIVPYTGQDIGSEESDEDDDGEDGGCDDKSALSVKIKACGFLPWFCSKNSIRLLNPLPSMKTRSKMALSSASKVTNLVKNRSWKSPSPKLAKEVQGSNHKHKVEPTFKSCELQKPKLASRPMFYSGELQTTRSGSPYRSSRRSNSPARRTESPYTLYQKGVGVLSMPKRVNPYDESQGKSGLKDAKANSKRFEQLRRSTTTPLEEAMYIDSVNIAKVSHSILNLPKTKRHVDVDSYSNSELRGLSQSGRLDIMKARGLSGPLVQKRNYSSEASKIGARGNMNTCRELVVVGDDGGGFQSPLTPPLPKSPSESWLSRNLPSVSPRNSVSYSSLQLRKHNANGNPASGAKWENIVKSSYLHHDHGRYSEELVTHVPQRPQTRK